MHVTPHVIGPAHVTQPRRLGQTLHQVKRLLRKLRMRRRVLITSIKRPKIGGCNQKVSEQYF